MFPRAARLVSTLLRRGYFSSACRTSRVYRLSNFMPAPTLQLTRDERLLCMLLDDTCRWICATDPAIDLDGACRRFSEVCRRNDSGISLEARIAGGWVRDKVRVRIDSGLHSFYISLRTISTCHSPR